MTPEEAIDVIKHPVKYWMPQRNEADRVAVEALEKMVPKKPAHIGKNYYCPVCREDGWVVWDDAMPNEYDAHCGKCGQAIDWSDAGE